MQSVDTASHAWGNYFLAAYKGLHEHLRSSGHHVDLTGLSVMVDGQVPTGSGLSSSAAFTCGAAIALLKLYGIQMTKASRAVLRVHGGGRRPQLTRGRRGGRRRLLRGRSATSGPRAEPWTTRSA